MFQKYEHRREETASLRLKVYVWSVALCMDAKLGC